MKLTKMEWKNKLVFNNTYKRLTKRLSKSERKKFRKLNHNFVT